VRTLRQASLVEKARVSECIRDAVEEFRVELTAFIESDVIFAISDADREEILHLVPNAQVVVIPNIHDAPENVSPPDQRRDLLLAAGFIGGETSPNTDAANFFVKDIWPIIERELPGVRLHIVGANPPSSVTNLRSQKINVTGRITEDELAEYYETCKVAVIPLRFGAGLKNKTTEAMAYGLPLVTTSTGVESSKLIDGESAFVTDDPGTFAQRVVQLYRDQDMWSKFSRASREIAIHDFSADAVSSRLETIFQIHPNN
jgi:glycosyltransferase involved in cell wall biosynthesis